ncbi:MAG: sulfurtransferase [Planctomycetaceae bacterium]|nr:sulfurtransferase [Planctomycetaceae bacterium]
MNSSTDTTSTDFPQSSSDSSLPIVNIAAYKFVPLDDLESRREHFKSRCDELKLRGTILLSPEGINCFLAGSRESIDEFLHELRAEDCFGDLEVKESFSDRQPFNRMLVRLKKEIIAFGIEEASPLKRTSPKLSPAELKQWLDEGRPVTLLDTRNDYEVKLGTFENAVDLDLDHFRNFPQAIEKLPPEAKEQPMVMFCTGGIRCEKAGPFMEQRGYKNVYQLEGGILKYFEEIGGAHWNGECFVFDQRVGLDPNLKETETTQCFACQMPLSAEEQESEKYVPGQSCPYCFKDEQTALQERIREREAAIREWTTPLPGSIPYDNVRPMNVPERFDRRTVLEFVSGLHDHLGEEYWKLEFDQGRILYKNRPIAADRMVRSGERYDHLYPATTEPDVNADIRILFEDHSLVVVNKPAPLPMHPSGRFNRNTLQSILNHVYDPQILKPAHRLDANTSGVVVFSRTRSIASRVQPQFEDRAAKKVYLARVQGHPEEDRFRCETRIGSTATQAGLRLPDPNGQEAITEFQVLRRDNDGTALLEVRPLTGRTNQIRLHLWDLKFPIVGDPAYLPNKELGETQTLSVDAPPLCLHAWKLALMHPTKHVELKFKATPPEWAGL